MADVMRKRWDFKANPAAIAEFPVLDAVGIEIGDLLWWDPAATGSGGGSPASTGPSVRPASATGIWTGTLAGSRGKMAEWFVGVAMSAKVASDGTLVCRVAQRGTFGYPLDTAVTFEIGDLVTVVQDGANNFFLDQQVTRLAPISAVANAHQAIGRVMKRYSTATSVVEFEIAGRMVAGGGVRAILVS